MALLNDPKKFFRKNVFCSESFNSQKNAIKPENETFYFSSPKSGHLGPRLRKFRKKMENRTFGHCIEFGSFGWPYNSYCDSWQRYVASNDGQGADKSILVPRFGPFRLNLGPKMTKIEIFGHFNEFGTSDRVEIAYFDSTKQSSRFGHGISHVLHN